jgi:prepilin-type processing-associated H-X9-DG protein
LEPATRLKSPRFQILPRRFIFFDNGQKPSGGDGGSVTNIHSNGANFVFVDGHVKRFKKSEYWNGSSVGITNNPDLIWTP